FYKCGLGKFLGPPPHCGGVCAGGFIPTSLQHRHLDAELPNVVDSGEPSNTSSPVLSAVKRFNREFLLPPPTINSLFRFFPVIAAIDPSTSAYRWAMP